jgi:hypothetical protein
VEQTVPVLIETIAADGAAEGLTPHYVRARIEGLPLNVAVGDVVEVRAVDWRDGALECVAGA